MILAKVPCKCGSFNVEAWEPGEPSRPLPEKTLWNLKCSACGSSWYEKIDEQELISVKQVSPEIPGVQ
jgi:hypothetical protein